MGICCGPTNDDFHVLGIVVDLVGRSHLREGHASYDEDDEPGSGPGYLLTTTLLMPLSIPCTAITHNILHCAGMQRRNFHHLLAPDMHAAPFVAK